MSAFDQSLRLFPISAALLSGILASMAGAGKDSALAQESPVTGSSFSSATSVHDDKRVTNAVLQHSMSEATPLGEIQRGWTAAHGKTSSRAKDVVSLQPADARPVASGAKNRGPKAASPSRPRPVFMVSAGRSAIPPVPEPVRENSPLEDPEAVELSPVDSSTISGPSEVESSVPVLPALDPSAPETIPVQQPTLVTPVPAEKPLARSQGSAERPALSATERFKLALEEERQRLLAEQAADSDEPTELPSLDSGAIDLAPVEDLVEDMTAEQLPPGSDLNEPSEVPVDDSETMLQDERTRRFSRLKQQLMQLKTQLEKPEEAAMPESQPLKADEEASDPMQSHPAADHEAGNEEHSEELLPPVDGHDSHHSAHAELEHQEPDHHEGDAKTDASVQGHSSDVASDHSAKLQGHDPAQHEPAGDLHSGSHAIEQSPDEDRRDVNDLHGNNLADVHSADSGAAHAASEHAVVHGTIDRLGLANNLYAVGEYELAMDMYEKTDMTELTAQQQIWTDYQMANCLRRMGRNGDASNRYRRIAEQPEAGWLSEQSRWWVDVLEQIRQLQSSLEENPENTDKNLQSPFQGAPREAKSSGGTVRPSESTKSGSTKFRSTEPGHTVHPSGANKNSEHDSSSASSSGRASSRTARPSKERITHFAPVEKEPKHGEH
ncbi:MAG: hypothetical protein U0936_13580 [Planctomycetaceae bacterium]